MDCAFDNNVAKANVQMSTDVRTTCTVVLIGEWFVLKEIRFRHESIRQLLK
jgi:hypothetical protein